MAKKNEVVLKNFLRNLLEGIETTIVVSGLFRFLQFCSFINDNGCKDQ